MITRNILREIGLTNKSEIQGDMYKIAEWEHVIFYTIGPAKIEIIDILNHRMDIASNLH